MKRIMKETILKIGFAIAVTVLFGCSNKYESLVNSAPPPGLSFNKDTISIREKDVSNINWTDNGRLTLYCNSASHQLNVQFYDTSGKVHLMYRGEEIKSGQLLPAIDSINVFITCDTLGVYVLDFILTDVLGKISEKQLVVNCHPNYPATPSFFFTPLEIIQLQNWPYRFDASLSSDPDGVIQEYHFSINGQPIVTSNPVMEYAFHAKGMHSIGLFVTDDLGKNSDTLFKTIFVQ